MGKNSCFQKPLDKNNPQATVACSGVAHSVRLHSLNWRGHLWRSLQLFLPVAFSSLVLFCINPISFELWYWSPYFIRTAVFNSSFINLPLNHKVSPYRTSNRGDLICLVQYCLLACLKMDISYILSNYFSCLWWKPMFCICYFFIIGFLQNCPLGIVDLYCRDIGIYFLPQKRVGFFFIIICSFLAGWSPSTVHSWFFFY